MGIVFSRDFMFLLSSSLVGIESVFVDASGGFFCSGGFCKLFSNLLVLVPLIVVYFLTVI